MYSEDFDDVNAQERSGDDVYSKQVRAGKRTYFFDVKATRIFLYKEDFEKFAATLQEMVDYIRTNCPAASPSQTEGDGEENTGPYKSDITFDEL